MVAIYCICYILFVEANLTCAGIELRGQNRGEGSQEAVIVQQTLPDTP